LWIIFNFYQTIHHALPVSYPLFDINIITCTRANMVYIISDVHDTNAIK